MTTHNSEEKKQAEAELLEHIREFMRKTQSKPCEIVSAQIVCEIVRFDEETGAPGYNIVHCLLNDASLNGMLGSLEIAHARLKAWLLDKPKKREKS